MSTSAGIIGLPNAGKSTLFNALSKGGAAVAEFPFSTISPNLSKIPVPDPRLDKLASLINPQKVTPAFIEIVDVAGLIRGAHRGEGLGNEFLSIIRGVDLLMEVVRCFECNIPHPEGKVDPLRDVETIKIELLLSDLEIIERRLTRLDKLLKSKANKNDYKKLETLKKIKKILEEGNFPRKFLTDEEYNLIKEEGLLSVKPLIYVANTAEENKDSSSFYLEKLRKLAREEKLKLVEFCAQVEMELAELSPQEERKFRAEMGLEDKKGELIRLIFEQLDLISFFTITGGQEVRAWALKRGTPAIKAAGKIHSDIERGFIRAEVVEIEDLLKAGDLKKARAEGKVRLEGKDYQIQDGQVIHFYFNV